MHHDFYPNAGLAASDKLTFEGAWSTNYGDMRLVIEGDSVKATYADSADSTLVGTVKGRRLDYSYAEPTETGEGWFELSSDGLNIAGKWRKTGGTEWKSWTGKRIVGLASVFKSERLSPLGDAVEASREFGAPDVVDRLGMEMADHPRPHDGESNWHESFLEMVQAGPADQADRPRKSAIMVCD